jgi:hypothetical protein
VLLEQVIDGVLGGLLIVELLLLLMREGYWLQVLLGIEHLVRELGDVGVHTTLPLKDSGEGGAPGFPLCAQQSLEERLPAGREGGDVVRLLHHGRQLLMVADKDETVYPWGGKESDYIGLQYLGSLIDNT